MKEPTAVRWNQVVIGIEVSLILNKHPGLFDRGLILGLDCDAIYETLITLADALTAYHTLGRDYFTVEDDLHEVLDFLFNEIYPDCNRTSSVEARIIRFRDELIHAALDFRKLLPMNATHLFLLNRTLPETMVYVGALLHKDRVPEDYWKNAEYYRA